MKKFRHGSLKHERQKPSSRSTLVLVTQHISKTIDLLLNTIGLVWILDSFVRATLSAICVPLRSVEGFIKVTVMSIFELLASLLHLTSTLSKYAGESGKISSVTQLLECSRNLAIVEFERSDTNNSKRVGSVTMLLLLAAQGKVTENWKWNDKLWIAGDQT